MEKAEHKRWSLFSGGKFGVPFFAPLRSRVRDVPLYSSVCLVLIAKAIKDVPKIKAGGALHAKKYDQL